MSEFERTKAALLRAAADGGADLSVSRYANASEGVAKVLWQIESQVLAQRIDFKFEGGTRFACIASGRRLLRLLEPAPRNLPPNLVALFVRKEILPEYRTEVGELLMSLCERGRQFTVTSEPIETDADPSQGGVSPLAVSESLGLRTQKDGGEAPEAILDEFVERIAGAMIAGVLVHDEDVTILKSDPTDPVRVSDWSAKLLERLLEPSFPLLGSLETSGILVFRGADASDRHMLVAGRLGRFVVASVNGGDASRTLKHWQRLCRGQAG
jgi:hypothetical protein